MNFWYKYKLVYSILLLGICIYGCGPKKTILGPEELQWLNVYNEGDTLIFKSRGGLLDTSYIIKKERFYPEYAYKDERKYLPEWGVVWYKNKNLFYHPDGDKLITIEKKTPDDNTFMAINYLYGSALVLNKGIKNIRKHMKDGVYEFDTSHPRAEPSQPKKIYWHLKYGIIKYITHDNIEWERINLKGDKL
jgi:hypothetical protein